MASFDVAFLPQPCSVGGSAVYRGIAGPSEFSDGAIINPAHV
jgi:hypothetical protein